MNVKLPIAALISAVIAIVGYAHAFARLQTNVRSLQADVHELKMQNDKEMATLLTITTSINQRLDFVYSRVGVKYVREQRPIKSAQGVLFRRTT